MFISVIMPVYNEAANLDCLQQSIDAVLQSITPHDEFFVVDGGSTDNTMFILQSMPALQKPNIHICSAAKGRALQMNHAAQLAKGDVLLFVHADTVLPNHAFTHIRDVYSNAHGALVWGRFDVRISGDSVWFKVIAWCMNVRSRITRIATGDQCIVLHRQLFRQLNGYANMPLLEDVELCHRLKQHQHAVFKPLAFKVTTSGRRWEKHGIFKTILLMWRIRWAYWCGASADVLAQWYRDVR